MINYYLLPLVITIITELFCLVVYKEKRILVYLIQILMNCITNISLNYILRVIGSTSNDELFLFILELVVFVIEGSVYSIIYKNLFIGFTLSFCCNILSYSFGIVFLDII